jgi:hypothetical protein
MGMSTNVKGFISDKNELYQKHAKVLKACMEAGIKLLPKETADYFGSEYPEKYLLEEKLKIDIPVKDYNNDMEVGYEIIISEIPDGVYKIRFYNSY